MKKTRHTEEQIAFALKQAETGTSVAVRLLAHLHPAAQGRMVRESQARLSALPG